MGVRAAVAAAALSVALSLLLVAAADAASLGTIAEVGIPTPEGQPYGIAAGPDGNLWFAEIHTSKIGRITPGGEVTEFTTPTVDSRPNAIATGADGNLWFSEFKANKIGRIAPWGAISEFEIPTPESGPVRITLGPDGNMWFVEEKANKIGRITPAGAIAEFTVPTPGSSPSGIAWGADGNLWFTEAGRDKIGRVSPTGTFAEFPIPTSGSQAEDITAGPEGNLWFTEPAVGANKVARVTPAGEVTEFPLPTPKAHPEWITAGPDGNLWFTEAIGNKIGMITPAGSIGEFELPTAKVSPAGIVTGADGNLWFAEEEAGRIGRIGAGAAGALLSAPAVAGGGQQGSAQTCTGAWSTWDSLQPQPGLLGFDGYRWLLDGTLVATGQTYVPTVANIGHQLACSVTATYPLPLLVTSVAASAPVTVTAPPTPVIAAARESATKWRAGSALARISRRKHRRRPPVGTTISFGLNVQAGVTFTFTQAREGRRVGRTCVGRTHRNAHRRRCARTVSVGALSFAGHAGTNTVSFDGRLSASSRLAAGRYALVIVATNTAGVRSAPKTLYFAIVR